MVTFTIDITTVWEAYERGYRINVHRNTNTVTMNNNVCNNVIIRRTVHCTLGDICLGLHKPIHHCSLVYRGAAHKEVERCLHLEQAVWVPLSKTNAKRRLGILGRTATASGSVVV